MQIEVVDKNIDEIKADVELIFVLEKDFEHRFVKDKEDLKLLNFKGNSDEVMFLLGHKRLYIAVEEKKCEPFSDATAAGIKKIITTNIKTLKVATYCYDNFEASIELLVEGIVLGSYKFNKYKSKKEKNTISLEKVYISTEAYNGKKVNLNKAKKAVQRTKVIANAVNFTRDIVNSTPDDVTPVKFANIAKELSKTNNLKINIYDEKYLKETGMNAFYSVARGSIHPPRLVHLVYKPKKSKAKVAIIGKGLTYDSGGLSLKPSNFMTTMKSDKSGASAALGIIKAASEMKLDIEIHAICGLAENMIGQDAYKPDDVLVARNKKSIEVRNTDAEGRLVLADCLVFAQEEVKPDFIIDIATLTGACVVALGEYTSGVMGNNEELIRSMINAADDSGELASYLPFNKYLPKLLKSEVADISNISSSRYGGAITAALFLNEFIEDKNKDKWLHIDIAGPAYVEKEWGVNPHGASGAGVRMVVEWLRKIRD